MLMMTVISKYTFLIISCFAVVMLVDFIANLKLMVSWQLKSYSKPLFHHSSGILCWPVARRDVLQKL